MAFTLRGISAFFLLLCATALAAGCSDSGTGPEEEEEEETSTASAVATPSSATIVRGTGSATITVVYSATADLVIGRSYTVQKQYGGIVVEQTNSTGSSPLITKTYMISADQTVPLGSHNINFSTTVDGYSGSGSVPSAHVAFPITVVAGI